MRKKKAVVAISVALLLILSTGAGCTPKPGGAQELDAVSASEPPVSSAPAPEASTANCDDSRLAGNDEETPDCSSAPDGNTTSPAGTNGGGTGNNTPPQASVPASSTPAPANPPQPTPEPTPTPTPAPTPAPEPHTSRTICNTCGADITGNVPAHGDGHLLNGENFSYRVE